VEEGGGGVGGGVGGGGGVEGRAPNVELGLVVNEGIPEDESNIGLKLRRVCNGHAILILS
jgi:hypothetical protein